MLLLIIDDCCYYLLLLLLLHYLLSWFRHTDILGRSCSMQHDQARLTCERNKIMDGGSDNAWQMEWGILIKILRRLDVLSGGWLCGMLTIYDLLERDFDEKQPLLEATKHYVVSISSCKGGAASGKPWWAQEVIVKTLFPPWKLIYCCMWVSFVVRDDEEPWSWWPLAHPSAFIGVCGLSFGRVSRIDPLCCRARSHHMLPYFRRLLKGRQERGGECAL